MVASFGIATPLVVGVFLQILYKMVLPLQDREHSQIKINLVLLK